MNKKKTSKKKHTFHPNEAGQFIDGQYYPEQEAYYHICRGTGWGFFGWKNQVYLGQKVKSAVATHKRAQQRALPPIQQQAIDANDRALKRWYTKEMTPVGLINLALYGFDESSQGRTYTNKHGIEIHFYKEFGYYRDKNVNMVRIFRKSSDFARYEQFDGNLLDLPDRLKNILIK